MIFPLCILGTLIKISWLYIHEYFWAVYSIPLIYWSKFRLVLYYFNYCSFAIYFEIRKYNISSFIHFSQDYFGSSVFCGSTWISRLFFSISIKYAIEIPCCCAAKSLQSCLTLCDPIDSSPPGSSVPGILQARTWDSLKDAILMGVALNL